MRRAELVIAPDFAAMRFAAGAVFEMANRQAGEALYEVDVLSDNGGLVASALGNEVWTQPLCCSQHDTLLVGYSPYSGAQPAGQCR